MDRISARDDKKNFPTRPPPNWPHQLQTPSCGPVHLHKESEKIRIKIGVRQGDTISPKLFTATLESIFRRLNWEHKGVKIDGEFLSNLRFADDIFLCTETPQELQQMLQELSDESRRMGLKMNTTKTKVIVVDNTRGVARGKCMWKQVR